MNKNTEAFLEDLLNAIGPSGYEAEPVQVWDARAKTFADSVTRDLHGNTDAVINTGGNPRVMLAGHIDEIGFIVTHIDDNGFLAFDAIGGWRNEYEKKMPVNAAGKLPNGDAFSTVPEFRKLMMDRTEQFNRCLTEKLMKYAIGRELEIGDRPDTDAILQELKRNGDGLRDLITLIVLSDTFQSN